MEIEYNATFLYGRSRGRVPMSENSEGEEMSDQERRAGSVQRTTLETDIRLVLNLDGTGKTAIDSDVPFLDHMLTLFGVHGFFDLSLKGKGDVQVDDHHTVEDAGYGWGRPLKRPWAT